MASKKEVQSEETVKTPKATFDSSAAPFSSGVHVMLPSGDVKTFDKLEVKELLIFASEHQITAFDVYSGDKKIKEKDFPLTSGDYKIVPVNKAGA
jgi:hypothetical protein